VKWYLHTIFFSDNFLTILSHIYIIFLFTLFLYCFLNNKKRRKKIVIKVVSNACPCITTLQLNSYVENSNRKIKRDNCWSEKRSYVVNAGYWSLKILIMTNAATTWLMLIQQK